MGRYVSACALIIVTFFAQLSFAGYGSELNRATKHGRIYAFETLDASLIWHASFFDERFRAAFIDKHLDLNRIDDAIEASAYEAEQRRAQADGWEFVVALYAKKDYQTFTNDGGSFWRIQLITSSGERLKPENIVSIPVGPYEQKMYPYLNRWSKLYRVTFPKVNFGDSFELNLRSVAGESALKWKSN